MGAYYATGPPLRTVGALDLGGSSLEVTFLPPPGAAISADVDKGASRYPIFPAFMHGVFTGGLHSLLMPAPSRPRGAAASMLPMTDTQVNIG